MEIVNDVVKRNIYLLQELIAGSHDEDNFF